MAAKPGEARRFLRKQVDLEMEVAFERLQGPWDGRGDAIFGWSFDQ